MILLTGAGGFIGSHLFRHLKKTGREVLPLYHSDEAEFLGDRWALDLANPAHLAAARSMSLPIDTVIHLAGRVDIALKANPENALLPPVPGDQDIADSSFGSYGGFRKGTRPERQAVSMSQYRHRRGLQSGPVGERYRPTRFRLSGAIRNNPSTRCAFGCAAGGRGSRLAIEIPPGAFLFINGAHATCCLNYLIS
jgi:hypothetical protein